MKTQILIALACMLAISSIAESKAIVGTNLGGWLVLEPWITPSLFYRFLGKTHEEGVGLDAYTFCEALGAEEGNRVMKDHMDTWVTEETLQKLKDRDVEMIRVPIGDWTLDPYGPYVGCKDGAADKVQWVLDTSEKIGLKVLIDVHTARKSQNGFDNSGMTGGVIWKNNTHYSHWGNAAANWLGEFEYKNKEEIGHYEEGYYKSIDHDNIKWSLNMTRHLLEKWGKHPALAGFQPVNEPWWNSPIDTLKDFYREVRLQVKELGHKDLISVFHDSFIYSPEVWNDLFEDNDWEKVVIDHHYYQAFFYINPDEEYSVQRRCGMYHEEAAIAKQFKADVWIGEWSLALDNCAHWLNGFNDAGAHPQYKCKAVECPRSYLPERTAVDFDRKAEILGPFGYAWDSSVQDSIYESRAIRNGKCWTDSEEYNSSQVEELSRCVLEAYDNHLEGHFMWTAHNELEDRWSYINSYDKGWINRTALPNEATHYKNFHTPKTVLAH